MKAKEDINAEVGEETLPVSLVGERTENEVSFVPICAIFCS
jgi:hypothetical protein